MGHLYSAFNMVPAVMSPLSSMAAIPLSLEKISLLISGKSSFFHVCSKKILNQLRIHIILEMACTGKRSFLGCVNYLPGSAWL